MEDLEAYHSCYWLQLPLKGRDLPFGPLSAAMALRC